MPLRDSLPADPGARARVLDNLVVFVEHHDGTGDGQFSPEGSVTRAQMATIAYRWMQDACAKYPSAYAGCTAAATPAPYAGVAPDHWAAQAVKVLDRLFGRMPAAAFPDVSALHWAFAEVAAAASAQ